MKRTQLKRSRIFRIAPELDTKLRKEAKETNRTQTAIVEMALRAFFVSGGAK